LKNIKLITYLVVISLSLQFLIFLFLDWKAGQLLEPFYQIDKEYIIDESLAGADTYSLSYNNKFLGCVLENNLKVVDLTNRNVLNIDNDESIFMGYKWLPDRNGLVYFTKSTTNDQKVLYLYSLDLESENQFIPKLDRTISLDLKEILEIEISTYTNNLYVLGRNQNNENELIKIDLMKNYIKLNEPKETITKISVSNKYGVLFIESLDDSQKKRIAMHNNDRRILVSNEPNMVLLNCSDNFLYIGRLDDGYLTEIYLNTIDKEIMQMNSNNRSLIWQGRILFEEVKYINCIDSILLLINFNSLYIFEPNGKFKKLKLNNIIVPPSTRLMYLELITGEAETRYYWRSIPISPSSGGKN